jgi:hypothetical protein
VSTTTSPLRVLIVTGDLVLELAGLHRRFGLVLRADGEGVLILAGDLPLLGDVLGRVAHVIALEGVEQAVRSIVSMNSTLPIFWPLRR